MKTFPTRIFLCAALASVSAGTAFAGGHGQHSSSSSSGFAARPAARSGGGSVARFSPSGGGRRWNAAGNFRQVSSFNRVNRVSNLNRNGVRWNSASRQTRNVVRNGNARWNGNHRNQWANHHNGNGNGHGHWRRCGNRYVFIFDYGYPWYYPYSYYDPYYYPYGAYQSSYGYDYNSDDAYAQPVYQGNNVDESYAPADDQGTYSDNPSVADVQRLLARAGFYKGAIDGAMGPRTFYAIRAYQRSHNLQVDGQIGPQLLSSLGRS